MTTRKHLAHAISIAAFGTILIRPAISAAGEASPVNTAQAASSTPREITAWVSGGIGTAGIRGEDAMLARVQLSVGIGRHLLSLSLGHIEDTNGSCGVLSICPGNDVSVPHNSATELALRYGAKARGRFVLGTASLGVATVSGVQRGQRLLSTECLGGCVNSYDSTTFRTIGATAEIGGYATSRFFSIGPTFIADVNPVQSFWAVLFDVHFGFVGNP